MTERTMSRVALLEREGLDYGLCKVMVAPM